MTRRNVIIIGAAGRDFHNFNTRYRTDDSSKVVAFTATQIPDIEGRRYPPELAGPLYPEGIPIYAQDDLPRLIADHNVDECVFSYSDVSYQHVMGVGAVVQAAGAAFMLLGPDETQLPEHQTRDLGMCGPNRMRQEPDLPTGYRDSDGPGSQGGRGPPPDAVR